MPNDRIAVLEWMNADWAKGRNERTGQEGIFPRSYVNIMEKEPPNAGSANYGNMPLDVSQTGSNKPEAGQPSKFNEQGKKFGKKMGNAGMSRCKSRVPVDIFLTFCQLYSALVLLSDRTS